jgi:ABC-type transport system involved in cytochrome c biogenesis permease subunit
MKHQFEIFRAVLRKLASLKLAVFVMTAALVLIFLATLDQSRQGIYATQKTYFQSWFVIWSYPPTWPGGSFLSPYLCFPLLGGHAIGLACILNLSAALVVHLRLAWRHLGIWLIHIGLISLLATAFIAQYYQEESQLWLMPNQPTLYAENRRCNELVLVETSDPCTDSHHCIADWALRPGSRIPVPGTPLVVAVERYYPNAQIALRANNPMGGESMRATKGLGQSMDWAVFPVPPETQDEAVNAATAFISLYQGDKKLGTWLVSNLLDERFGAQQIDVEGRSYNLSLRFKRTYFPFYMQLSRFVHERHPGTNIPKYFQTDFVAIHPQTQQEQNVTVAMNHPWRWGGYTFYQASFSPDDNQSMLQVVYNPIRLAPYVCIALVGLGLGLQLLWRWTRKKAEDTALVGLQSSQKGAVHLWPFGCWGSIAWWALCLACWLVPKYPALGDTMRHACGALPVQHAGRLKPLLAVAKTGLQVITGRSSVPRVGQHLPLGADAWMLECMFRPDQAHARPLFKVYHPELLAHLGAGGKKSALFSYHQLWEHLGWILEHYDRLSQHQSKDWTPYEKALHRLGAQLRVYRTCCALVQPAHLSTIRQASAVAGVQWWLQYGPQGLQAFQQSEAGLSYDASILKAFILMTDYYLRWQNHAYIGLVPHPDPNLPWLSFPDAILKSLENQHLPAWVLAYASWVDSFPGSDGDSSQQQSFIRATQSLKAQLAALNVPVSKVHSEYIFYTVAPFDAAALFYGISVLGLCWGSALRSARWIRGAEKTFLFAWALHTLGWVWRVYLQGRPPVTSLYASALFVGWAAASMCAVYARYARRTQQPAVAVLGLGGTIACVSLWLAHYLGLEQDTLECVRAVLDANWWLSTHVVIITLGYAAMWVCGAVATWGILQAYWQFCRARFGSQSCANQATVWQGLASWSRVAYGLLCFALLFSFVGTMLGGVWADQSWGRFWGWDPKENGALMIVLWCAIVMHAKLGQLIGAPGLLTLCVGGNIITAWSWFGTNMLGVGLHSYGFMDQAFWTLVGFVALQGFIMLAGFGLTQLTRLSPGSRSG